MNFIPYGLHWIDDDDINEVVKVLKSDWITTGPKIHEFEDAICTYTKTKHCVAVNSGTSALDISVQSLDLPEGSEVITTPFTFVATSNSIIYNRLKPVFADICADTRNIDPEAIRDRITDKTRAITYVDYAGQPCDIEEIKEIADEFNLYLIEDASHAIGAEYHNKKVGNFADLTIFSFHPVKHITTGEGGAVVTNNKKLYEKSLLLRNHGIDKTASERYGPNASWAYDMKCLGRNYRITDFQASLGISQLKKLDSYLNRREKIAKMYNEIFENIPEITTPEVKPDLKHSWHLYTVLLDDRIDRDLFFAKMRYRNIGVNLHYIPIHKFSYYQENYKITDEFPVTEDVFRRIVTLPLFPLMSDEDVLSVIDKTKETIREIT